MISEAQLFGARARQERRRKRAADPEAILRDLQDLNPGAPVVHEEYGVGRYVGLHGDGDRRPGRVSSWCSNTRTATASTCRCSSCTWSAATPARPPRTRRCTSSAPTSGRARASAPPSRSATWPRNCSTCTRAARRSRDSPLTAGELDYQAFANAFPFEETADQAEAIRQVLADLRSERPMDRIVCGDVGFGKTEVAMRAAFVAAQAGKQVAVLAPTTLLAQQHLANFRDRFADWPVRVEALSRFGTAKRDPGGARGPRAGQGRHRHRHPPPAARARALQGPGAAHHRRGAPLRRARQGAPAGAARQRARADPHRHPDPAHAQHGARRPARPVADHHAAGGAPGDQDLPHRVARADAARGGAARAAPRRPDVLRAQRGAHHREDRRRGAGAGAGGERAHRPRPDARARTRAADGGLLSPPLQRAGVHHHHRERHRRADAPTPS